MTEIFTQIMGVIRAVFLKNRENDGDRPNRVDYFLRDRMPPGGSGSPRASLKGIDSIITRVPPGRYLKTFTRLLPITVWNIS